jgi:hypothetical protein
MIQPLIFSLKPKAINGVNFGDGIVDNERFGMRRFVDHSNINSSDPTSDPSVHGNITTC